MFKLYSNSYQDEKMDIPNLVMINFKESQTKIKNGIAYWNLKNSQQMKSDKNQLNPINENPYHSAFMDNHHYSQGMGNYGAFSKNKTKTDKIISCFADEGNYFNFLSKSGFNLNRRGTIDISSVKVNRFDSFSDGEEYLTSQLVWIISFISVAYS